MANTLLKSTARQTREVELYWSYYKNTASEKHAASNSLVGDSEHKFLKPNSTLGNTETKPQRSPEKRRETMGLKETFNIYKEPLTDHDPHSTRVGFFATLFFTVFVIITMLVLSIPMFQRERVFEHRKDNPTYRDFLAIQDANPVCACIRAKELETSFESYEKSISRKYDTMFEESSPCDLVQYLDDYVDNDKLLSADDRIFWYHRLVINPASERCNFVFLRLETALQGFSNAAVPSRNAISFLDFQSWVLGTIGVFEMQVAEGFISARTVSTLVRSPDGAFAFDIKPDEVLSPTTNYGYTCADEPAFGMFEYTIFNHTSFVESCSVASTVMRANMRSWNADMLDAYRDYLEADAEMKAMDDFSVWDAPADLDGDFEDYLFEAFFYYSDRSFDKSAINVTEEMHREYYEKCQPSECRYTERRLPTVFELFSLNLGLYGGLTAFFQAPIGKIAFQLCRRRSKRLGARVLTVKPKETDVACSAEKDIDVEVLLESKEA